MMQLMRFKQNIVSATFLAAALMLYGCATHRDSAQSDNRNSGARGPQTGSPKGSASAGQPVLGNRPPGGEPVSTIIDARPAALVNGQSVTWGELRVALTELAGAEALQELILDRKISEALAIARITISPDDIVGERKLLLESMSDDPDVSIRLLDELRDRQKLGPVRFEAMLRRNAGLRALIRDNVSMNDHAIESMHDLVHGPKRQARIMVLPDLKTAEAAQNLIRSGVNFSDVAVEMSTDSSSARGGLLQPVSRSDPAYPESLRQTLWTLNVGEISGPVLLEDSYALIMLIKRIAGDGVKVNDARPSLERLVRINQERLLMDQLARRMLAESTVSVFDDALNDSWKRKAR